MLLRVTCEREVQCRGERFEAASLLLDFGIQATLETTQGQKDGFFVQVSFKCYLLEVAFVGD